MLAPSIAQFQLAAAVETLHREGVLACPTEAVWGLSCDPASERAVGHILALKQRPVAKGLILVAASEQQLEFLLHDLPEAQRRALRGSWPGPNTWLVPHHSRVPAWVSGVHATVAVRVTEHPGLAQLCRAWGGPLVSTSANPAGAQAPVEAFQVRRYFGASEIHIVPGRVGNSGRPSRIRDLQGRVIRA